MKQATAEYKKRSQEIADTTRRVVITLNSGGIGVVYAVAGTLVTNGVSPDWALIPVSIFIAGMLFTGISLFLAKHRELKRLDMAKMNEQEPEHFKKWYWRSFTWDLVAFALFGCGAITGLFVLGRML